MPNWLSVVLKVVASVLILALIATQLDFLSVGRTLSSISIPFAFAGFLVVFAQALATGKRTSMVVARFGAHFRVRDSIWITLESIFFSQTFVSFLGGDALRIWRIRRLGLPLAEATSAIVLDRLLGLFTNHIFLLASLPWLLSVIDNFTVRFVLILLAIGGIAGFAMIFL